VFEIVNLFFGDFAPPHIKTYIKSAVARGKRFVAFSCGLRAVMAAFDLKLPSA
jgi:hypothetical protein